MLQYGILAILPQSISTLVVAYLGIKVIDMLLGILKSWKNQNYKSSKMRDGIVRWIAEMVAVVFVIGVDVVLGLNYMLCGFTLALFIYKEGGSILENLHECGVELPIIVAEKLEIFNQKTKGE
jgi:toxin secretion/phage lysis holin|nr:MAG TPA: holin [Caudoviricetes sp.]